MVSLPSVLASNAQIPSALPEHLVAVFAGATSGIGEATLKTLVKYAVKPRIYLFARTQPSAERTIAECRQINPSGTYTFVSADLSSIKQTDLACEHVKQRENHVNLVVLSAGQIVFGRTPEGLNAFLAASTYTRVRIAQNLLPLLATAASAPSFARVLDVAGGTYEGAIDTADISAFTLPLRKLRPQLASMHTLAWEVLAEHAPGVSFVHNFPGSVETNLYANAEGWVGWVMGAVKMVVGGLLGKWLFIPIGECGEREVYCATSARYGPRGASRGVACGNAEVVQGSDGGEGNAVYSVNWDGEKRAEKSVDALRELRARGVKELVWEHINAQFDKITAGAK